MIIASPSPPPVEEVYQPLVQSFEREGGGGNSGAPFGRGTLPLSNQFKMNLKVTPSDWRENEACISNATGTGLRALLMQILLL